MAADTPAVVLGAGANGLGVARSLARARVPVWLLDSDARRPEMHTRAAKPVAVRALHGEALVEDLVRLGTTQFSGMRPVLLLTQEESVKTVSHHRDRLSALYRFSLPTMDMVDTLLHKEGFQRLAEQLGSPIPPLVHVRTLADLPALEKLRYPVVIKPGERNAEYGRQFKKAYRVESADGSGRADPPHPAGDGGRGGAGVDRGAGLQHLFLPAISRPAAGKLPRHSPDAKSAPGHRRWAARPVASRPRKSMRNCPP